MDLETLPPVVQTGIDYALQGWEMARGWLVSPAAWSQLGLLILAWLLAVLVSRRLSPRLARLLTPAPDQDTVLAKVRRFTLLFLPLLLPLLAFAFTAAGEAVTRSMFGSGAVIAFGKRLFLFLAVRGFVREVVTDAFLALIGRLVLIPLAAIYVVGLWDPLLAWLAATVVPLGNMSFSLLAALRFTVVAGVMFWIGRWSNEQSAAMIASQQGMRPATRQLAVKTAEILIFGAAFLIAMNIAGVPLTSLAVLTGALGVGIGFGLQKIASNFISGVILLLEGQATVGDYVELDGGEAGIIVRMTARAIILETFDGRWIVVPNEDFIVTRVINYSDSGSAHRYEAPFSVSYDTDINRVPDIVNAAVEQLPFILRDPEGPDCELVGFGESGIDFQVEYWVEGIDDGKNKYKSHVLFAIWNALKAHDIEIPYPHRVIEMRGPGPAGP